jgi:GNAT superfamily N-acetyltransferase
VVSTDTERKLDNGYHLLPVGRIAAVVTYLEMFSPPELRPVPDLPGYAVVKILAPELSWYRNLYRAVGEDWLWFSRLSMDDAKLAAILHHPDVEIYALRAKGQHVGLLELDFRAHPDCELAFLGLTADQLGSGAGRLLMNAAIQRAWSRAPAINRFFVHTCTLDHPGAIDFYQRSGFTAYGRAVEIADDPRLDGRLPPDAAGWYPKV